jgi:hypothetical protein
MFRSTTIVREFVLSLAKVILKHSVKHVVMFLCSMFIIPCIVNQFPKNSNKMTLLYSILLIPVSRSICFGRNSHPSSGARFNCIYSIWC